MTTSPEVSVVIPTYNEREKILSLIDQIGHALGDTALEIVVVDDDSPDGTAGAVEQRAQTDPRVRLIRRRNERGLGAAVCEGFRCAHGRYLAVMDADHSHDPMLLGPLLAELRGGVAIAVGSRRVPGGGAEKWPWFRRQYSDVATRVARLWLNTLLSDPMSGYFMLQRELYESVCGELNPKGYKILLEIVTRGRPASIKELPFIFKDRKQGESKLTLRISLQYFQMLWQLRSYSVPFAWRARPGLAPAAVPIAQNKILRSPAELSTRTL
jgi:dolichol-phosphate mannosyltransferase